MMGRLWLLMGMLVLLSGCGPRSQEDYRYEGQRVSKALVRELQTVHRTEDLNPIEVRVTRLFDELVDIMIAAREYRYEHPSEEPLEVDERSQTVSRQLQREIERIRSLEGGAEWLERCQEEAEFRLAAFERQLARRRR